MLLRSAQRFAACTATLQAIISGTASSGGKLWSRIAPATAENANPARPDTKAPVKAAALSSNQGTMVMVTGLTSLKGVSKARHEDGVGRGAWARITSRGLARACRLQSAALPERDSRLHRQ